MHFAVTIRSTWLYTATTSVCRVQVLDQKLLRVSSVV